METVSSYSHDSEPQQTHQAVSTLKDIPVYVVVEMKENRLVTAPNGVLFEGVRALPGGVESNAKSIALKRHGLATKGVRSLSLAGEDSTHVTGLGYVLTPTLEAAKDSHLASLGLEVHTYDDLVDYYDELHTVAEQQKDPELLARTLRHTALLRAYGRQTLRSL